MSERTHGCWLDLCEGGTPNGCVFENGEPVENCCVAIKLRADGKTQWACEHWKPLNPEQPSEAESLRAEIACLRLTDAEWVVLGKVLRRLRESMWRDSSIELVQMASVIDGLLERHKGGAR